MNYTPTAEATRAVSIICNINSSAPRHKLADAREAEVDLIQRHIDAGMTPEDEARALKTIKMINRGHRRFGGVE